MRFIDDDEIPLGPAQLVFQVVITGNLVQPDDSAVRLQKGVARHRGLKGVTRQDVKVQLELEPEFILPLCGQVAGHADQAAVHIATDDQFFDEQPGHDRLACAGVVGQQEAQRLAGQHLAVHSRDLVGQRLNKRGVDGQHRVEEMRKADAVRLSRQPEEVAACIEGPVLAVLRDSQVGLVIAIQQPRSRLSILALVEEFDGVRPAPLGLDDGDTLLRQDSINF